MYSQKNEGLLSQASAIIADLNCPKETLEYLGSFAEINSIPLVLVPVSSPKMSHLPERLDHVTWLICNRDESETHLGMTIKNDEDWRLAAQKMVRSRRKKMSSLQMAVKAQLQQTKVKVLFLNQQL